MNQPESPFRIPTTFPFLSWDILVFLLVLQNVLLIPLFFFFCHTTQHVGSLSSLTRDPPHPPHWKHRVLTTGLPGKSLILFLDFCFTCSLSVNCTSSSVAYLHILLLTTLVRSSLISLSKISDSPTFYLLTSFFLLLLLITTYIVSYASLRFLSQAGYKQ